MILVKPLQPWKAEMPIEETELGIMVFLQPVCKVFVAVSIMALQLSLESYFWFSLSTLIFVNPLQPSKAIRLIEETELGIVTLFNLLQPQKAARPIDVTELPIVTLVNPLQLEKASSPIEVTEIGI